MKLRVVDSVLNPGGGERFLSQMVRALLLASKNIEIDLCGSLASLKGLESIQSIDPNRIKVFLITKHGLSTMSSFTGISKLAKNIAWLQRKLRLGGWTFNLPPKLFEGCDLVWLPWATRHRLPALSPDLESRVLTTFHDTILLDFHGLIPPHLVKEEIETSRYWMNSRANLIFTSKNTLQMLEQRFGKRLGKWHLIRLPAEHQSLQGEIDQKIISNLPNQFFLCPANISPHKNHEILFRGLAPLRDRCPLVLTGSGTDLGTYSGRSKNLLRIAQGLGYEVGKTLFPLGYVSEMTYEAILKRTTLLVMPTLGEGGGSWPVSEALLLGKPTIVSDIPVMKEFAEAYEVSGIRWFDPVSTESLMGVASEALDDLAAVQQEAQTRNLAKVRRPWSEFAKDYLQVFISSANAK